MKKFYFSALIFCCLLVAAQTNAQDQAFPLAFDAHISNHIVKLRWRAFEEQNTDRYVLERASDTVHFAPLHEIVALGGTGFDYSYQDEDSYPGTQDNYYRIKIISKDGNFTYSPVILADMEERRVPLLSPTVLHMGGTVRLDTFYPQPVTVNFFNAGGAMMGSFIVNGTSFDIPTSNWGKGIYFYRISDARHPLIDAGKIMVL